MNDPIANDPNTVPPNIIFELADQTYNADPPSSIPRVRAKLDAQIAVQLIAEMKQLSDNLLTLKKALDKGTEKIETAMRQAASEASRHQRALVWWTRAMVLATVALVVATLIAAFGR